MNPTALVHLFQAVLGAFSLSGLMVAFRMFSERAADLAVTAVWQGALVVCGLAVCLRLVPRISAQYRFKIWLGAFFALVSLPVLALLANLPLGVESAGSSQFAGGSARPLLSVDARWSLAIAALWAIASLVRVADLAMNSYRLRKIWKQAKRVDLERRILSVPAIGRERVDVCTTSALDRPSVIGFFKPRILIPDWLFERLTAGELEQIILHEAEHLRRRDDWTNLLQKLCLVIFPLNPAMVWIERRLCREREMACDEAVVRVTRAPRAYAACLTSLAEHGLERRAEALSLGAWHRRPELVHRVHSILRGKGGSGPVSARVLLGAVSCLLIFGSVELARCPQLVAFVPLKSAAKMHTAGAAAQVADADLADSEIALKAAATAERASTSGVRAVPVGLRTASHARVKPVLTNALTDGRSVDAYVATSWKTRPDEPVDGSAHAKTVKAERRNDASEQEWLVLTTWRVETNANARVQADYDTSAADQDMQKDSQPGRQPASRITVTRLIMRVLPLNTVSDSSRSNSTANEPGSATVRDGWLIFQL